MRVAAIPFNSTELHQQGMIHEQEKYTRFRMNEAELAIFGKTPMKLPLAKRSFDLDLDNWLGNRKEPNSQMHV